MSKRNGKGGAATLEAAGEYPVEAVLQRDRAAAMLEAAHDAEIAAMISPTEVPEVRNIPLVDLAESPKNKRHFYDEASLDLLGESMCASGQTTPILVRPLGPNHSGPFEIAAGHRRFRAAKRAGLKTLLAIVREMDDALFLEILTVENLQREDIHALDEAELFAQMQLDLGWDVERIATRMKKSTTYVYDALAMRTLIDPIRELFFAGHPGFTRAHAVELARLTTDQQTLALEHTGYGQAQGLWTVDAARYDDDQLDVEMEDDTRAPFAGLKPRSVRELKSWIREQCRLDPAAESIAIDFPETATELEEVEVAAEPMVEITDHRQLTPEQKAGSKILTNDKWRESETGACEHTVRGFHSIGSRRGAVHYLCAAKRKCRTHWGAEIREKEKAAKERESEAAGETSGKKPAAPKEAPWEREQRLRNEANAQYQTALPAIRTALLAAVKKASTKPTGPLGVLVRAEAERNSVIDRAKDAPSVGKTADDLVRYLAWIQVAGALDNEYWFARTLPDLGKALGVDVKKIVKESQPKAEKPRSTKQPAKKAAKKKARAR